MAGLAETLSGFFEEEYNRFMAGLERMSRSEWEIQAKQTRRDRENAAKPKLVEVPRWDDVIKLEPRLAVTAEQRDEYWRAVRAGRDPQLGAETIQEIERRRAKRDAMARSAQPEYDRAWGSVMTAVDNVQDLLGAMSVLGRISLSVGGRLGARLLPGIGPLVIAADVLNLAMLAGQLLFPAWLAICAGPREALTALAGTAVTAGAFKGSSGLLARASARSLRWTGRPTLSARTIGGWIGAALVVGQSTEALFGRGISLGAIVGATMGAVYGAEAASRGEAVEVRRSPSAEHFGPRIRARLEALSTPALYDRMTAADVFTQAALVLSADSPATAEDRRATLAALNGAIGILWRDWRNSGWQADLPRLEQFRPTMQPRPVDLVGWPDLTMYADPASVSEWPRSWGGATYDRAAALQVVPGQVERGLHQLTEEAPAPIERAFASVLVNETTEGLWLLLTNDEASVRVELTPDWLAWERMSAAGVLPLPNQDEAKVQRWWDEALSRVENSKHALMTRAEWLRLAGEHQVDVVQLGPPSLV